MHIPDPLLPLFDDGIIHEVIRPLMSGKEAAVFVVRAGDQLCVAKVYKDAQNRSFRQRSAYAEGRTVRNTRQQRAMAKGSRYGKALLEAEWQNSEVNALYRLHDAGVRVPTPMHYSDNVLLMEMITDSEGNPAPRLWDVEMSGEEATKIHKHLIRQVVRILCAGMVHGDLSEYNILMSGDGPVIIDLPQTTDAAHNQNSERIFLRDVKNLKNYLGRFAPKLRNTQYGREIWNLYRQGQLHPESELTGRFQRKRTRVDTASVIAEIQASAAEASERPMSAYQEKKIRKAEEAVAEAKRVEEREAQAQEKAARRAEERAARGETENAPGNTDGDPNKRRRKRRRRRRRGPSKPN
jgi:RIO kinase 1